MRGTVDVLLMIRSCRSPLESTGDIFDSGLITGLSSSIHTGFHPGLIFVPFNGGCRLASADTARQGCLHVLLDDGAGIEWEQLDVTRCNC